MLYITEMQACMHIDKLRSCIILLWNGEHVILPRLGYCSWMSPSDWILEGSQVIDI